MKRAWSWSALEGYETCPKQYWHLKIAKDYKEGESEPLRYGKFVHKALEHRVARGTKLPLELTQLEPMAQRFADAPGTKLVEQQLAINENYQPTGWFDDDVYCRVVLDLAIIGNTIGVLVDWKTGKVKDDVGQLELGAAVLAIFHPQLRLVHAAYGWTKTKKFTKTTIDVVNVAAVWNSLLPRVNTFQLAFERTEYPARPSGLCKRHCIVTSCPHHGG